MRAEDLRLIVLTRVVAPLHGMGGLERHSRDLLGHLLRRGVTVGLITQPPRRGCADATLCHERLTTHFVPYRTFPLAGRGGTTVLDRSTAYPWFGWRAGRLAADLVRKGNIDLVHGMGAAALGYAAAREHDWYETVPLLLNPHGMEEFGSTGPGPGIAKYMAYAPLRASVRRCARAADRVVATDAVLVPTLLAHLPVAPSRVTVVPNAVDLDAIDHQASPGDARALRQSVGLSPNDLLLVGVGRLEENKGFHVLIDALAKVARRSSSRPSLFAGRWRLVLVGDGSQRGRLARDIAAAGLDASVVLRGRVSDAELHAWYEAASLFVHPSLYEGSSIVTLEAMAHRLAVVATMAGGIPDKVHPGLNGWLVPPGEVDALATALEAAAAAADRFGAMGAESRAIVEREFSWPAVMDRLLRVYEELLSSRGSSKGV